MTAALHLRFHKHIILYGPTLQVTNNFANLVLAAKFVE